MHLITLIHVKEHKDGSATYEFGKPSKKLKEMVRNCYKKKRVTKKLIGKFIIEALTNYVNEHSKVDIKDLQLGQNNE